MAKKNKTLKDILDLILYENPSTQDEIANRLGISRRYVTQLIQPLIKDGTIKRAYVIDMKSYEEVAESLGEYVGPKDDSGNVLINDMLYNMSKHVHSQLEMSFDAILESDEDKANKALVEFLAKKLHCAKSNIQIIKGALNKEKTLLIAGCDEEKFLNILK